MDRLKKYRMSQKVDQKIQVLDTSIIEPVHRIHKTDKEILEVTSSNLQKSKKIRYTLEKPVSEFLPVPIKKKALQSANTEKAFSYADIQSIFEQFKQSRSDELFSFYNQLIQQNQIFTQNQINELFKSIAVKENK